MSTYHINPESGRPNVCRAGADCKIATKKGHFATLDEAKLSLTAAAAKKAAPKAKVAAKAPAKPKTKSVVVEATPVEAELTEDDAFALAESVIASTTSEPEPEVRSTEKVETPEADELLAALIPGVFEEKKPEAAPAKQAPHEAVIDFVEEKFEIVKDKTVAAATSPVVTKTIENVKKDAAVAFKTVSTWGKDSFSKLKSSLQKKD